MLEFLRRKKPKPDSLPIIYYKNGEAFFQSQCEFGHTVLVKNTAVVALVLLDAEREFGTSTPISIGQDGSQLAALRVASEDAGFLVFATPPSAEGEKLQPGDVVLWVPYEYRKEAGDHTSDKRSGWVGLIRAKIKPEINPANPSFVVACRYD
jgi:hypothetical protein